MLAGAAAGQAWAFQVLAFVMQQARISTATGFFLDAAAKDFLGNTLPRKPMETDDAYRARIRYSIFRPRATREAIRQALFDMTGYEPVMVEPWRPQDTGGWGAGSYWGAMGAWGNEKLPHQAFITAYRPLPPTGSFAGLAGWGTLAGGWGVGNAYWSNQSVTASSVNDEDIYNTVQQTKAFGTDVWVRIINPPTGTPGVGRFFTLDVDALDSGVPIA
jgi:hypothetical protein